MKKLYVFLFTILSLFVSYFATAQANVLNPADPDLVFTSTYRPATPNYNVISKWGHTKRLKWDTYTEGYKSYYFKGVAFRLKFPKSYKHNVADGKKYPVFVFFHGLGQKGDVWDNEI